MSKTDQFFVIEVIDHSNGSVIDYMVVPTDKAVRVLNDLLANLAVGCGISITKAERA